MSSDLRSVAVLDLVFNAAQTRGTHYREQAAQLRAMAAHELAGKLRDNLLELAGKYESMADDVLPADDGAEK